MEDVKMFLFGRWMSTCYSSEEMNNEDGSWWALNLEEFNNVTYQNYLKNGTVENTRKFLEASKAIRDTLNDLP